MDNTLSLKLKEFKKAINSLEAALKEEKSDIIRDSTIKRFEYCFELCWKTAKVYLRNILGIDIFSPKECFKELRKHRLVSDEETEVLLQMTNERNEIIHTYNEKFADKLYEKIATKYFNLIKVIYQALEKQTK
jgi:nucleotidyltransferase substrate binding protein (TIGR01987 family)